MYTFVIYRLQVTVTLPTLLLSPTLSFLPRSLEKGRREGRKGTRERARQQSELRGESETERILRDAAASASDVSLSFAGFGGHS